ncbi:LLM class flavin-dependent oxidoreductase [Roseiarcaceae bacterium H3SJ34-1]|uniref:LLM class flavin-dependent oxidoreductase n=1 Tax=Terripilifer ovatus TaxID=3032367 RepID=UPI003AB94350|nr:LLM class flavin-dependent oxidoreductase [Roseiarcaceae bacterium H3SJ34-1]
MKFGVLDHLDFGGKSDLTQHYEDRLKLVEALDQSGFYGYHITEHHGTTLGGAASPSVFLSAAIQRTRSIRLGTLVYALPTHHPLRLIEEICMLDQMSGGRLDIGFGRGSVPSELTYFGLDPSEAAAIYTEALEHVIEGLRDGRLTDSKRFRFNGIDIKLRPAQRPHPPVWYGVHSPESAERAAKLEFHIVCNQAAENSAKLIQDFRQARARMGKDPESKLIGLHRSVVVAPSDAEASELAEQAYTNFIDSFRYVATRHGVENKISGRENSFAELMAVGRGVAGSPETVAAYLIDQIRQTGANYCLMYLAFGNLTAGQIGRSVELFVSRVMPLMRKALPAATPALDNVSA